MRRHFAGFSSVTRSCRSSYVIVGAIVAVVLSGAASVVGTEARAAAASGAPTVTGLAPSFGSTAGGTTLTIEGTGLGATSEVLVGGHQATGVVVRSSTNIRVTTPAQAAGTVNVRVLTPSGSSDRTSADLFDYIDLAPGSVEITQEFPDRSCAGDRDVATWVPPDDTPSLVGFQVVVDQFTDSTPQSQTFTLGPDQDSVPFVEVNGETDVLVSTITAKGVSPTPFGTAELTGFGVPEAMDWNESGGNSVSDGSATVAFEWAGPPQRTVTGGDVSADTVEITESPDGQTEDVPASLEGVTPTFSGLTDGSPYTYSDTVSDECGTSGASDPSPEFTPGVVPSITGSPPTAVVGEAYDYALAVTGVPAPVLSVTAGALPPRLSVGDDGTISGTATAPGTYDATVTATNGVGIQFFSSGQASDSFTMTVDQAPAITSASYATFDVGEAGSFDVTSSGFPAPELSETGALPDGVQFVVQPGGTATISGTPDDGTAGTYPITISASNRVTPTAVQDFVLTVAPTITSAAEATTLAGSPFSFTFTTAGSPVKSITKSGKLPQGLHFVDNDDGTATIAGTPGGRTGGVYQLTITATFGKGTPKQTVVQEFTLFVDEPLAVTSPASARAHVGSAFNLDVNTVGYPGASNITESGALPAGIIFTYGGGPTATLSGTPDAGTEGVYSLAIEASNNEGGIAWQTLVLVVKS